MKKHHKFLALLLSAALLTSVTFALTGSASATDKQYWYGLYVTDYTPVDGGDTYTLTMNLYTYRSNNVKDIVSASFGLQFPTSLDVKFTPSDNVELLTPDPSGTPTSISAPGKSFFIWSLSPGKTGNAPANEISGKTVSVFNEERQTQTVPAGVRLHIGTFTAEISEFPARSSVGVLNWYATDLSKNPAYTTADPSGATMNDEIWNDSDGDGISAWQGFHQAGEADPTMVQTDVPLIFNAPEYWPNAFTVLSYDPKKPISVSLSDGESNAVTEALFTVPQWEAGVTTADSGALYAVGEANKDSGRGAYYAAVDMGSGVTLENGKTYTLTISKPGHLPVSLSLTGTGGDITEAQGFPAGGESVYLPAGDIDPALDGGNTRFGNGRIDMADRAALMSFMVHTPAVPASGDPSYQAAWLADIDGDGRVTQADLSILMSQLNYAKIAG